MPVLLKAGRYQEPDAATAAETYALPLPGRSGYVFGFWQIRPAARHPVEGLAHTIEDALERLAEDAVPGTNVQHRFERFLRSLNDTLAAQVRDGAWNVPVGNVHALVGVACDGKLFFSGMGDLSALFLHRRPTGHYQVFNLFRSIQTEQALPSWEKPFAVVLDGDLHAGDVLAVSNQDLQRYVNADDLNHYLATLPPASATEKIRQHFPARTDLSLLILQAADPTPGLERAAPLGEASVAHLVETEAETGRLLDDHGPSFLGLMRDRVARWKAARTEGPKRPFYVRLFSLAKTGVRLLIVLWTWGRKVGKVFARVRSVADVPRVAGEQAGKARDSLLRRVRRVPKSSLYLLAAAGALVLALAIGISALSRSQAEVKAVETYATQVRQAEERRDQANAALIYRDEARAGALLRETRALVDELPTDTPEQRETVERLRADIAAASEQIRNVVNIPDPPVAADLAEIAGADARGTTLVSDGGAVYAFGADHNVYRLDTATKSFVRIDAAQGGVGAAQSAAADNGTVLFLDDRPGLSRFDTRNRQLQVTDLRPETGTRWMDVALYGGRLYLLAPDAGQVLRYNRTETGFGPASNWIQTRTTDLSDAVSMAIDGTIFVLKPDGTVARYASGNEVGWSLHPTDPPVSAASKIWTDPDTDYVYVLEPAERRLLVYAKQSGAFLRQYRSDAFADLSDFLVDERARTAYLLSGSKLYAITLGHL